MLQKDFEGLSIEDLSPFLQELAEQVGLEGTLKFIESFGGQYMYIPRGLGQGELLDHPIIDELGLELAQKLGLYFDGDYVQIPTGKALLAVLRRQKIRADLMAGLTRNEIASRHGVTVRTVYAVQSKLQRVVDRVQSPNSQQLSLFAP